MKKQLNLLYYIIFVAGLWLLNRHFQIFVSINGALQGLLVGLILAFLAKLIFKTLTAIIVIFIVIIGIIVALYSVGFFHDPDSWDRFLELWRMFQH